MTDTTQVSLDKPPSPAPRRRLTWTRFLALIVCLGLFVAAATYLLRHHGQSSEHHAQSNIATKQCTLNGCSPNGDDSPPVKNGPPFKHIPPQAGANNPSYYDVRYTSKVGHFVADLPLVQTENNAPSDSVGVTTESNLLATINGRELVGTGTSYGSVTDVDTYTAFTVSIFTPLSKQDASVPHEPTVAQFTCNRPAVRFGQKIAMCDFTPRHVPSPISFDETAFLYEGNLYELDFRNTTDVVEQSYLARFQLTK